MSRHKAAKQEIISVIKWADTQGFSNIADALRLVLPFVHDERNHQPKAKR